MDFHEKEIELFAKFLKEHDQRFLKEIESRIKKIDKWEINAIGYNNAIDDIKDILSNFITNK